MVLGRLITNVITLCAGVIAAMTGAFFTQRHVKLAKPFFLLYIAVGNPVRCTEVITAGNLA